MYRLICAVVLMAMVVSACTSPTPAPTTAPIVSTPVTAPAATTAPAPTATPVGEEPLYLSIVWHQHQPLYYKDPATGIYTRPWVRVHATKDYYDMASTVAKYPNVHVTFNLTPVLLRQLDDFIAGAKDIYWVMAEKPADQLTTTTSVSSCSASSIRIRGSWRAFHGIKSWLTNAREPILKRSRQR